MSSLPSFRWLLPFFLANLYFRCMNADSNLRFFFKDFGESSDFESRIALYGDAKVVNGSESLEISGSGDYSAGKLICKKPFSLVAGNSTRAMAFSSYFTFSVPREIGNGFAFFMQPADFPLNFSDVGLLGMLNEGKERTFSVEFDAFKNGKYGELRRTHVGHDLESHISVKESHIPSSITLKLYSGEKLQAWINYEASGKRAEVSLRKLGSNGPYIPLISFPIDLSALWGKANVVIGLTSLSRNSSQKTSIYSWSFASRNLTHMLHSVPLNTGHYAGTPMEVKQPRRRSDCDTRILIALIFGAACGSLAALFAVFIWGLVGRRLPVMPEVIEVHEAEKKLASNKVDAYVKAKTEKL